MYSLLQKERMHYQPKLPNLLQDISSLATETEKVPYDYARMSYLFPKTHHQEYVHFKKGEHTEQKPLKIGVVFSGGQAPGGHNVVAGLFDALKKISDQSKLFGFLGGPGGILENRFMEITGELLQPYRNQGGFDLIGSGRTKIEAPEQFAAAGEAVQKLDLDGLVIVGGDDSNTNAAFLAEYFEVKGIKTKVIGVPKTIDGDLKNDYIEASFGFDTATKTYSDMIGSVMRDALSAKKYFHFIRLMGRSASHIVLECALQTHPNMALISEEIQAKEMTLADITHSIADMVCKRALQGKNYGVILIPEGLIEFIPEFKRMIGELNKLLAGDQSTIELMPKEDKIAFAAKHLSEASAKCFWSIPHGIQLQLLKDRDPHGNVQVSKIETERLLIESVNHELISRQKAGTFKGKFNPQPHFYGYEGRSCFPSNFDCKYCYALGVTAALLVSKGLTGYMCSLQNLYKPVEEWQIGAVPIISMMHLEERSGKEKAVISKALVDLKGYPFRLFKEARAKWEVDDDYHYPGPIQFHGSVAIVDAETLTLEYESTETIEFEELNYETILQKPWVS